MWTCTKMHALTEVTVISDWELFGSLLRKMSLMTLNSKTSFLVYQTDWNN